MRTAEFELQEQNRVQPENSAAEPPRILFLARPDVVTRSLVRAIADSFEDYQVELVGDCTGREKKVALVAVHAGQQADVGATALRLRGLYPEAMIALLVSGPLHVPANADDLMSRGLLQGIVPLSLALSTWLAAFGLLLAGGMYMPVEMMMGHQGRDQGGRGERKPEPASLDLSEVADLTQRERDVLNLLAAGLQNKIIAARLNLSEHTVKVHVHNIIRKLRVHNRTQAAAHWLTASSQRPDNAAH